MLMLLLALYGDPLLGDEAATRPKTAAGEAGSAGADDLGRIQGLQRDAAMRRAVELTPRTEPRAPHEQGWTVERVGHLKLGYDLECRNSAGQSLHVEVKGSQGSGEEVFLTRNEVFHLSAVAACPSQHALYVLSEIMVTRTGPIDRNSGKRTRLLPWSMDMSLLTPTVYSYRVPRESDS